MKKLAKDLSRTERQRDEVADELEAAQEQVEERDTAIVALTAEVRRLRSQPQYGGATIAVAAVIALIIGGIVGYKSRGGDSDRRTGRATITRTETQRASLPPSLPSAVESSASTEIVSLSELPCSAGKFVSRLGVFRGVNANRQANVLQEITLSRENWRNLSSHVDVMISEIETACVGAVRNIDDKGLVLWAGPFGSEKAANTFCDSMGWRTDQHPDCYPLPISP